MTSGTLSIRPTVVWNASLQAFPTICPPRATATRSICAVAFRRVTADAARVRSDSTAIQAALPARIETLEQEASALKAEMESPDFYKSGADRINTVMSAVAAAAEELERLLARWVELEERQ